MELGDTAALWLLLNPHTPSPKIVYTTAALLLTSQNYAEIMYF